MKKFAKVIICFVLSIALAFSFAGCSKKVELTEENVNATVETAVEALHTFNSKDLEKYVDSKTLGYIISLAKEHEQFAELGRAMFENLSIEVQSIDLDAKTVTVNVTNKNLFLIASNFAYELTKKHSTFELLSLLKDEYFLDNSLASLTSEINDTTKFRDTKTVTLNIVEGDKNLVLSVDEEAEDAISGGALYAVKNLIG